MSTTHGNVDEHGQVLKQTLMNFAIQAGQLEIVEFLIKHDVDLREEKRDISREMERRRYRFDAHARKVMGTLSELSYLHAAAEAGHAEIIRALVKDGLDVNVLMADLKARPIMRTTVLAEACRKEVPKMEVIETLLELKADPNGVDNQTHSPLSMAACHANSEAAKLLLKSGALANKEIIISELQRFTALDYAKDPEINTTLQLACCEEDPECRPRTVQWGGRPVKVPVENGRCRSKPKDQVPPEC